MDTILVKVEDLLRTALKGRFATYGIGRRPLAESELPAVLVYPLETRERRTGTANDDAEFDIAVECVMTVRNADNRMGKAHVMTQLDLVEAVEGRDLYGRAEAKTVLGVLNGNITVGGTALYTDGISVGYETVSDGGTTRESVVARFTAHTRPPR
jgi:hypothetical protein